MSAPTNLSPIDAVDDRDRPVGTVRRGDALESGVNFRTVHVFVFDSEGKVLLQRLAPGRERHPGRWGSAVAAYLFAGESYMAAATRRLGEELGLDVPIEPFGKLVMRDGLSQKFVQLYVAGSDSPRMMDPKHIAELVWWRRDALAEQVERAPTAFTPTFRALFSWFSGTPHKPTTDDGI